jgi:hypothetical protein
LHISKLIIKSQDSSCFYKHHLSCLKCNIEQQQYNMWWILFTTSWCMNGCFNSLFVNAIFGHITCKTENAVCLEMKTEQWKQSLIYWLFIKTIYYSIMIVIYCTSNRSHDSRFSICICLCSALQYHCLFLCSFLFWPLHSLSFFYL